VSLLDQTLSRVAIPDATIARKTQALLDNKTKPRGSLGRLEELACRIAAARGVPVPELPVKAVVVMAGDHGVAAEGVSAFPQEVTWQMVANFVRGGAAINVLTRQAGAEVIVADLGVKQPVDLPGVRSARVGPGTGNIAREPAMTRAQAIQALEAGIAIVDELAARGVTLVATGEMGIANTTPASALAAHFTGLGPDELTGRGTGVDEAGLARKREVVRRALALHSRAASDPLDALARLGGFEIAGLAGLVLGAAARRIPVLVDGFISSTAALCAVRIAPAAAGYLVAAHRSVEPGHRHVLTALDARPLLELEMRLGEGTGAALAMHLVEAAIRILREMATFTDAGVSDSGA
jgi:nicotinate-nucleotide--dimethylbenzimidazole phosphoribosyltransferase